MIFQITDNPDQVSFSDSFFRILPNLDLSLVYNLSFLRPMEAAATTQCTQKYFVYSFQHSRLMMMI